MLISNPIYFLYSERRTVCSFFFRLSSGRWERTKLYPFTTGNPFLGTKLLAYSIGRGSGALKGLSSPHFHVFSYTSCVDLSQLHSQSSWFFDVSFSFRDSDSTSCPYRRSPLLCTPAAQPGVGQSIRMREYVDPTWPLGVRCGGDSRPERHHSG